MVMVSVHLYNQIFGPEGVRSYVFAVYDRGVTSESPVNDSSSLVSRLIEGVPVDFQGEIPVNWNWPSTLNAAAPRKEIISVEEREEIAGYLPDGVTINLE